MIRHSIQANIPLECGTVLKDATLVFHTSAPSWDGVRKVIWICHALTANSDPQDWWPEMVGPGKPIDTDRHFVVCVNFPGSSYGSVSAASINPESGKPWLLDFPALTIRDMASVFPIVQKHLGIDRIDLLIGSSIGGFHALEWAVSEPGLFRKLLVIASAPRVSPYLGATVEIQRMALEADPTFREAADIHGGSVGLRCARAQAVLSYRCFDAYRLTQAEEDPDTLFAGRVASYERYQGEKLLRRGFDAYCYYTLCNALDSHNTGRGRGGVDAALGRISAQTTIVSIDTDSIFPPLEGRHMAACIPGAVYHEISSNYGHDGFLIETAKLAKFMTI